MEQALRDAEAAILAANAEDMAAAAVYLASRAGDYVVGSTLVVDGGVNIAR